MSVKTLDINTLKDTILTISPNQCTYLSEACAVALEDQAKASGVSMEVNGDVKTKFNLSWGTSPNKAGWKEPKKFTEHGAVALSFFLTKELTEFRIIEEAVIKTGIDYWLGYEVGHPKYDALNFINARLEVSGILKETKANSLDKRVKEKMEQTKPTDGTSLPAYVSIVEFSSPKAFFAKKR